MKRIAVTLLMLIILATGAVFADGPVAISSPEDLLLLAQDPDGDFVLTEDLFLPDNFKLPPLVFSGRLDGQGHTIYNVKPYGYCEETRTVYDGNYKEYEGYFQGFFGILDGAVVENLNLTGAWLPPGGTEERCVFSGLMTGYMENGAVIRNCSVQGWSQLNTCAPCFGVGGIAGYGSGRIENCSADAVLVCTDWDVEQKDEQFMGGAYAAGYIDIVDCDIKIDGYDSDHGYVHNGGLVGMYIIYPRGTSYAGQIVRSHVSGRIRFFEDNRDRRAYCAPYIGEVLQWTYEWGGCTEDFERDEIFVYDENLWPCMDDAVWTIEVTPPDYGQMGYTDITCPVCGTTRRDTYTAPLAQEIELLDPAPIEEALQEAQQAQTKGSNVLSLLWYACGAAIVAILLGIVRKALRNKD